LDALTRLSGNAPTFTEKVWANAIHIHRCDADSFTDLLSLDDVDQLLTSSALRTPAVRLARDGAVLPDSAVTRSSRIGGVAVSGLVDARQVLAQFDEGATVILQGLHRYWLPLTRLVAELEQQLGHPCQANAYLTPPGSQGFARHCDTHDVFVLQTYGEKQWEVVDDAGVHEVLMAPGMSMYLPTGTPHSARAQDAASLHVTVGINRISWRDVLVRVVESSMGDDGAEPLPAGYHHDPAAFARAIDQRLTSLAERLSSADGDEVAAAETARFLTSRSSLLRGGLADRVQLAALDDTTPLRRRAGSVLALVPAGEQLRVLLGDRELRVPGRLAAPLTHIRQHATLRPSDLDEWLDQESRLVLTRRLVREGLLEVVR